MSKHKTNLKDGWTTDEGYKKLYQADEEVAEMIELLELSGAASLLDNGCGNGEISVQAAKKFPDLHIYGYDALESAIEEARRRASKLESSNLSFDTAWADDLPLTSATVDRALFRNVLHHIAQPGDVFTELARCMKPGGRLLLQTPYNHWEDSYSEFLSKFHLLMDDSHRRYYYTLESIQEALTGSGLSMSTHSTKAYPFPFVTEPMKDLVMKYGFEDRLKLSQVSKDTWSVTLYWIRVTATKHDVI